MLGEQLSVVVGDDVSDPKQGVSVANKFVADEREVRRRTLQFRRHNTGVGSLCRKRHPLRDADSDQPTGDRARPLECVPGLRT